MAELADQECAPWQLTCKAGDVVSDALSGAAGDAMESIADAVTTALIATIAQLGTLWTTVDAGDLTGAGTGTAQAPTGGAFNDQVNTLLGYATWIGLGISTIAIILLGITLATNARRGDGAGLVNTATVVFGGATLIGGATALVGFIVPQRSTSAAPAVGFIQDHTFYLTLALAVLSMIVAGARMVWTQRAEPAQDLLKGLLTLAVVTASGVALLNVLLGATDALAEQIIVAGIGDDFESDVQRLLGFVDTGELGDTVFLGSEVMLVIVGGLFAILINIVQIMLMVLRTAMLFLIAGVLPLSAAFMNTETGKTWFSKIIAWTLAFAFYKPAAALIYATGIQMTTSGLFSGQALLQFSAGLMLILASVVALPVLIGFLSPALGAMASSGGGGGGAAMGVTALGAAIPQGASRTPRGGQGFGSQAPPQGPPAKTEKTAAKPEGSGSATPSGADATGGGMNATGSGASTAGATAGAGAGAGTAGGGAAAGAAAAPPVAAAMIAGEAVKKGGEAVAGAVQQGAQSGGGSGSQGNNGTGGTNGLRSGTLGSGASGSGVSGSGASGFSASGSAGLPKASPVAGGGSGAKPAGQGVIPPQTSGSPRGPEGARSAGPAGAGAALRQGATQMKKQAQQLKNEVAKTTGDPGTTGNEDRTDGANRR